MSFHTVEFRCNPGIIPDRYRKQQFLYGQAFLVDSHNLEYPDNLKCLTTTTFWSEA